MCVALASRLVVVPSFPITTSDDLFSDLYVMTPKMKKTSTTNNVVLLLFLLLLFICLLCFALLCFALLCAALLLVRIEVLYSFILFFLFIYIRSNTSTVYINICFPICIVIAYFVLLPRSPLESRLMITELSVSGWKNFLFLPF